MRLSKLFKPFLSIPETISSLTLEGPFLPEAELLEEPDKYAKILEKTWFHTNLIISRDLLITSLDESLSSRDNLRIEAGITHHAHRIDLFVQDVSNFEPIAIDQFILLNQQDINKVHQFLEEYPLQPSELNSISPTIH